MAISTNSIIEKWWHCETLGRDKGIIPRTLFGAATGCAAYAALLAADVVNRAGPILAGDIYLTAALVSGSFSFIATVTAASDTAVLLAKTAKEYAVGTIKIGSSLLSKATNGVTTYANDLFGDPSIKLAPAVVQPPEPVDPYDPYEPLGNGRWVQFDPTN